MNYAFWKQWFAQPMAEKMKHLRKPGRGGYYPPASESPGFTGNPDPKEYFHFRVDHFNMDPRTAGEFQLRYNQAQVWLSDRDLSDLDFPMSDCVLRILHYFPTSDGHVGEAHRDFDLLTVSVPGTVPGLERAFGGGWVDVEGGVLVGEMLEIFDHRSGWMPERATTHRIRVPPNTERYSAAFFYLPPDSFELRPGFTARQYLDGVLGKAGTLKVGT